MAFTTVCAPYCSADSGGLLILFLVNGFHDDLRAVLLSGWQLIASTFAHERLSRRFAHRIALRIGADCSIFRSPTAFTMVCTPYCLADGIGLPLPPLANGFHDDLRTVSLSGWHRVAHTSTSQRLPRRFARRIAQRTAPHFSFFHSSTAFPMVRAPYRAADGSGLLIPPLVKGFPDGLHAVLLSGQQCIAHSSAPERLS